MVLIALGYSFPNFDFYLKIKVSLCLEGIDGGQVYQLLQ